MTTARATIVKGPHVLYTGADGSVTAGVRLRSTTTVPVGVCQEWTVNTFSVSLQHYREYLGLSEAEHVALVAELRAFESPAK